MKLAETTKNPRRCQIWDANLDPTEGSEMGGHTVGGTRPVLVLSVKGKGRPSIRVCVPLTEWKEEHVPLWWCSLLAPDEKNGLTKITTVDTSQIRALDIGRFAQQRGRIEAEELIPILKALGVCLGFELASNPKELED